MLVKLSISSVARYGKLWTGTRLFRVLEDPEVLWDGQKTIPNLVDAVIIERQCECGATTRKFKAHPVIQSDDTTLNFIRTRYVSYRDARNITRQTIDPPTCFITAGGSASINVQRETISPEILVHNWSGRVGGHVILQPIMVGSGYLTKENLPYSKSGYKWVRTYYGSTLSEYVLLQRSEYGPDDDIENGMYGWGLPTVKLKGECPPCREKEKKEKEIEEAVIADDGKYELAKVRTFNGIRYQAGCRDFTAEEALAHWTEGKYPRADLFRAAILADLEKQKED